MKNYVQLVPKGQQPVDVPFHPVKVRVCSIDKDEICLVVPGWTRNRVVTCSNDQIDPTVKAGMKLMAEYFCEATTGVAANEPVRFRNFRPVTGGNE